MKPKLVIGAPLLVLLACGSDSGTFTLSLDEGALKLVVGD
jgi:hypothetical protein